MFSLLLPIIYLSFISLGLPDGLLGSAWPTMYPALGVPVSWSGIIFMIISVGTVVSSLQSDRMTKRFGTGKVTAVSVAMTAAALFGFASCCSFWGLCLWAVPYGLGAGSVDASLNNYVAVHYESKHMSWLHCMWGIGATVGPYIMGAILGGGGVWNAGYRTIGIVQVILVAVLFLSLPIWKGRNGETAEDGGQSAPLKLKDVFAISGAKEIMITFFCYCALEQTAGLWAASYLVLDRGIDAETAASFASMFYLGITLGRLVNGFIAMRLSDHVMIRMGLSVIAGGLVLMLLPMGHVCALMGLVVVGVGCAPVYPCIIHSTPEHFGAERSQALVGVQMASAYVGTSLMPPLFGLVANRVSISLFPVYLLGLLILMAVMYFRMQKKTAKASAPMG